MGEIAGLPVSVSLMGLWLRNKAACRPIGEIVVDARNGALPGVQPHPGRQGFVVTDEAAALASMAKGIGNGRLNL